MCCTLYVHTYLYEFKSRTANIQKETYAQKVLFICFFVVNQFTSSIDRWMSWLKWWCQASEAADGMCHPFVMSSFSNPSQQALPLCEGCYACGPPQLEGFVLCACIYARVCVHMCVVALTNLFNPQPRCLYWWRWRSCRGGRRAFWKTPLLPFSLAAFSPLLHSPADIFLQTDWMN